MDSQTLAQLGSGALLKGSRGLAQLPKGLLQVLRAHTPGTPPGNRALGSLPLVLFRIRRFDARPAHRSRLPCQLSLRTTASLPIPPTSSSTATPRHLFVDPAQVQVRVTCGLRQLTGPPTLLLQERGGACSFSKPSGETSVMGPATWLHQGLDYDSDSGSSRGATRR